jgi:hypothetical protein
VDEWSILVPSGDARNLERFVEALRMAHGRDVSDHVVAVVDPGCRRDFLRVKFIERPPGPFNNCKAWNVGLASIPASHDILLGVDDITLMSNEAIPKLMGASSARDGRCLIHPAVQGDRYNHPELDPRRIQDISEIGSPCPLPLICAWIPAKIRAAVGDFDESFEGYGYSDHDYVRRAELAGFGYLVHYGVQVRHAHGLSVYRRRPSFSELLQQNRQRYFDKWGQWPLR